MERIPAELPIRIAARAIDVSIVIAVDVGLGVLIGFGFDWLVAGAFVVLLYFALGDAVLGGTPGKLALGLRVVDDRGERVSFRRALVREAFVVLGAIPFAGPFLALAAWAWIARSIHLSPLRQGKHDEWAGGTRVVRAADRGGPST